MNSTYSLLKETDCLIQPNLSASAGLHVSRQPDDLMEFATIDGGVIDYYACEEAVNTGAGIFIGGYFVGVSDFSQCYPQQSFMRS